MLNALNNIYYIYLDITNCDEYTLDRRFFKFNLHFNYRVYTLFIEHATATR